MSESDVDTLLIELEERFVTILDIESGWCSPHAKRDWTLVRDQALKGLEVIQRELSVR